MTTPLNPIVATCQRVAETSSRREKIQLLAACLRRLDAESVEAAVGFLSGQPRQGRIGVGGATLQAAFPKQAAERSSLTVADVDRTLSEIAETSGPGSQRTKVETLRRLLTRATPVEQDFLARLLFGELRQGALEGVLVSAVAQAAKVPVGHVRRALMLSGDLGRVAATALRDGRAGLLGFSLRLFHPLKPMLAQTAEDVPEALVRLGRAALEYKLDGARVQVHRSGDLVRVYSRRLNEVTAAVPEVVELVRGLPAEKLVLDGEVLAVDERARPRPFQQTMRRFGRKLDVDELRQTLPLSVFFFDCLSVDGDDLLDESSADRYAALVEVVPEASRVPRLVTDAPERAAAFLESALRAGHEGLVAKALEATYKAGSRGKHWLKVKPAHTLDLVVLAAEWGHGRRKGWLSNLHLGARDTASGGFVMLGKTFKGLSDEVLEWQTRALLEREIGRDGYTVHVRPELVVEIAFDGVQTSPQYPGGLALRFARVRGYRADKAPSQADTIETVRAIHAGRLARR